MLNESGHKRWVHPLFKPSSTPLRQWHPFAGSQESELVSGVNLKRRRFSARGFGSTTIDLPQVDKLSLFLVTSFITLLLTIAIVAAKSKFYVGPSIGSYEIPGFARLSGLAPADKKAFLSQLTLDTRRNLSSQIHYVAQLMTKARLRESDRKKLAFSIVTESLRANYDPLFVAAVINSESTFNRHAVSYAGALGLMQIMPDTGRFISRLKDVKWHGTSRLSDPEYNIKLGIAYLKHLEENFQGNRKLVLVAYNWGPKNVMDAIKGQKHIPLSSERYAKSILSNHLRWNNDYRKNIAQFKYMDIDSLT